MKNRKQEKRCEHFSECLDVSLHFHPSFLLFFLPFSFSPPPALISNTSSKPPLLPHPPPTPYIIPHILTLPCLSSISLQQTPHLCFQTRTQSADSYSGEERHILHRRRLTVPYVVFALGCAPTIFLVIGSSLQQQTHHLLYWGGIIPLHTYCSCLLQTYGFYNPGIIILNVTCMYFQGCC